MALAVIELEDADERELSFRVDIGTSRLYTYAIGNAEQMSRIEGFRVMEERTYEAPMQELPPQALGRTTIGVPRQLFEGDEARDIQLLSFREQRMGQNLGPTVSDPLRIRPQLSDLRRPRGFAFATEPPAIAMTSFREESRPLSTAMFLQFLTGIASKVLPVVTNVLSSPQAGSLLTNLLSGLTAAPAPAAGGQPAVQPSPVLGTLAKPENAKLLVELLQQLLSGAAKPAETKSLNGSRRDGYALALETDVQLSHAQVAPALLAALPALMPLLQQVLTPETVRTLIQTLDPTKVLGVITNGLQEAAKIGLESHKAQLAHLEKLNPGTGADDIIALLKDSESMALALTLAHEPASKPDYTRVESVKLSFAEIGLQTVAGRPQASFAADRELRFPLALETPRPIGKATLHVQVKDPVSLKVLGRRSYQVEGAVTGRLEVVPTLSREEVAKLGPGRECIVCATLVWQGKGKGRSGQRMGTSMTQLISLVGPFTFDRIEQTDGVIPLNDVELHRDFWHKAWQGSFARDRRKVVFNCKYHFALDSAGTANAQMETVTDTEQATVSHEVGRLKSGLVLNVYVLNKLLGTLPGGRPLDEQELAALKAREFVDRFGQAARTQVSFRGRPGDSAALWVYPEVKLQRVVLRSADEVSEAGQVIRFGEREVRFPIPVIAHFIGVASQ